MLLRSIVVLALSFKSLSVTATATLDQNVLRIAEEGQMQVQPLYGDVLSSKTSDYITRIMDHFHLPGLSMALLDGNQTKYEAFGYAELGRHAVKATPDTLYYIASLTKSFTAATLLHAFSQPNSSSPVNLKAKLKLLIPNFGLPSSFATDHATLADALSHRLGMPRYELSYGGPEYTLQDAVQSLKKLPEALELREEFQYFNQGYMLLRQAIETEAGEWMGNVTRRAFLEPLGMNATVFSLADALDLERDGSAAPNGRRRKHKLAHGYSPIIGTNESAQQPWIDSHLIGPGGMISSARDIAAWLRYFLDGHASPQLTEPLTLMDNEGLWPNMTAQLYAMGWVVTSYRGKRLIMHSGGELGFGTWMAYLPERRWGVVLLTNGDATGSAVVDSVFPHLMDEILEVPEEERFNSVPRMERRLSSINEKWLTSRERLFPPESLPNPRKPLPLPLENYEGFYWNGGYRGIELRTKKPRDSTPVEHRTKPVLRADWRREMNVTVELEWVNGENFIAWMDAEVSTMMRVAVPARFKVDTRGHVAELGLATEDILIDRGEMQMERRKNEGKDTHLYLGNMVLDPKKVKRENTRPRGFRYGHEPSPSPPEGLVISLKNTPTVGTFNLLAAESTLASLQIGIQTS
ncbi:Protein flp [Paramyrothecium foliicola]|nr:Protein flp [Paramyrothecium foliicola]